MDSFYLFIKKSLEKYWINIEGKVLITFLRKIIKNNRLIIELLDIYSSFAALKYINDVNMIIMYLFDFFYQYSSSL
jgi:hypothetical protein